MANYLTEKEKEQAKQLANSTVAKWIINMYKKDENGKVVLDENNKPVLSEEFKQKSAEVAPQLAKAFNEFMAKVRESNKELFNTQQSDATSEDN